MQAHLFRGRRFRRYFLGLVAAVFHALVAVNGAFSAELPPMEGRENLALGRAVVFSPAPDYDLTGKGGSDATDLTDGKLTRREDRRIWFDSAAVGWSYGGRVNLAVDLGRSAQIDEIAIRLLGGSAQAGVSIPGWIEAFVSDDGEHYAKVAECSRWRDGDFKRFGVPDEAGEAWIHCLRFESLGVRGRWIGLRMYAGGLSAADELYVFGKAVEGEPGTSSSGDAADFTVTHPQPYFHKPEMVLATNVPAPVPIGVIVPPGAPTQEAVDLTLELPPGVELRGGRVGSAALEDIEKTSDGGNRYRFKTPVKSSSKTLGRLYLQAPGWEDGQEGKLRYRFTHAGWESPSQEVPVRAVTVPAAPGLKRIMAGLGWWSASDTAAWPEALDAWEKLGLNSFPLFGHWMKAGDALWKLVDEARDRGMFIVNIDSPLHRMMERRKKESEICCQFSDGTTGSKLCPSYRGQFYQEEVKRFADMMGRAKADFTSVDIELWGWRGPVDSRKCTRCQKDFEASGLESWEAWQVAKGDEIWRDLVSASRAAVAGAGGPQSEIGGYDFRPGNAYQYTWSVDHLYPVWMQSSQVSTYSCLYPYHLELIGNEVREDRRQLERSDVLPWLTPGDAGTFSGECLQWALLECYVNGARGVYFWSGRVWDAESLIAYNRVVRAIAPVEELIVAGELAGEAVSVDAPARVSGIRRGDEMLVLAADYFGRTDGTIKLRLSVPAAAVVRDLLTGQVVVEKIPAGDSAVAIDLAGQRGRLLHVSPIR
ncbi:MAG: hypothetical protein GXX96_04850 [Planctomycetaceae bacterium]|nr:hypothetical protein [Planctomycetaceae bacterium]